VGLDGFQAGEGEEVVAEVHRLAAEHSISQHATFRVCAAQLLRFSPQSRDATPSFFTFEGDEVSEAYARWKLAGDDAWAMFACHPDLVDMADTDDGKGICLEWTASRRELAARRPELPRMRLLLESTPAFLDPDERRVSTDASRIGLGTFELRRCELMFHAPYAPPSETTSAMIRAAISSGASRSGRCARPGSVR